MTSLLRAAERHWHYYFTELGDDRTRGWFMTNSPVPCVLLIWIYYKFVTKIGPELMNNRKPFNIDRVIQVYNLMQICLCGWMAYTSFNITFGPKGYYNWTCQPIDTSMSFAAKRTASLTWMYFMIKLLDLVETVFFVLRKKFNQISFLHIYHHMGMIQLGYIATKYYPDGQGFILIPLNSLVHAIMYIYYFLTNYNPEYKKKIWWKKYITQMQIVQFVILLVHVGKVLLMPSCTYPTLPVVLFVPQTFLMTFLFIRFYIKAYLKPEQSSKNS